MSFFICKWSIMKLKVLLSIILFLCAAQVAFAQDEMEPESPEDTYIRFGPYFAIKAGVNGANIPDGRKNAVAFNGIPDFGGIFFYPLSATSPLGLTCDLSYTTYAFRIKGAVVDREFTNKFSYVSLCPSLYFSGVMLGFSFGIPTAANYGADIPVGDISLKTEVVLSTLINLKSTDIGDLYFFGRAGYVLRGLFKDYPADDPLLKWIPPTPPATVTNKNNPRPVSLQLGIAYMFKLRNPYATAR